MTPSRPNGDRFHRRESTMSTSQSIETTDESVLRAVPARTADAWAKSDPATFAAVFTPATNVVIAGTYLLGRDAVRSYIGAAFAGPFRGSRVVLDPVYVKSLTPELALVVTEGGVLLPGETEFGPQRALRSTWLLARVGDEWLVEAYHSSPIAGS
jgi:uncharacterized protein (TIGR02246 family)